MEARITCLTQQGERCADEVAQGGSGAGTQGPKEGSRRWRGASGDGGPARVRSCGQEQGSCFLRTQPCAAPRASGKASVSKTSTSNSKTTKR